MPPRMPSDGWAACRAECLDLLAIWTAAISSGAVGLVAHYGRTRYTSEIDRPELGENRVLGVLEE
jgi:hypothetical protein